MADNHNDDDYAMGMELFDGDMEGLLAAAPPPAPTSHLEPHLLESFPPLEQREEDLLEEALEAAVEDERLSEEQAFALLVAADRGDAFDLLDARGDVLDPDRRFDARVFRQATRITARRAAPPPPLTVGR